MLDFVDKTLCQITLRVPVFVIIAILFTILPRRNEDFNPCIKDQLEKILCIIQAVGNQAFKSQLSHPSCRLRDVVPLGTSQAKAQRIPQGIDAHVDFGAGPAAAAAERMFSFDTRF
jgi:hypothetical protein